MTKLLHVNNLHTGYGEVEVIHGLDIAVQKGQVHAMLGRNGAGKSTTLKAVASLLPIKQGQVWIRDVDITQHQAYDMSAMGLAYVPETRDVFGSLTVRENLQLAERIGQSRQQQWRLDDILSLFPNLANRLSNGGHQLSGGEQQMLTIGRALLTQPDLLILDEPTEGLAPIIVKQILRQLKTLKDAGLTILLVEQNLHFALSLADEITVIGHGKSVWNGTPTALKADKAIQSQWLGV